MPGSIVDVCVSVGQTVAAGDRLIVLESMKMENDIVAESAGTILGIGVWEGFSGRGWTSFSLKLLVRV